MSEMGTLVITARSPLAGSAAPPRRPRRQRPRATRVVSAVTTRIPKPRASSSENHGPGGSPRVVPARVLAPGARTVASPGRTAVISRAASASDEADGELADEDDTSKLIVACAIGLATGLGVALFNVAEHATHDLERLLNDFNYLRAQSDAQASGRRLQPAQPTHATGD